MALPLAAEPDVDRSLPKVAVTGGLMLITAFLFGYTVTLVRGAVTREGFLWAVVTFVLWISSTILLPYLIKSSSIAGVISLFESIIVSLFLVGIWNPLLLILSFGFLWLFLMMAFWIGRDEIRGQLRIRFFKIGRISASVLVGGINIFLAVALVFMLKSEGFTVPRPFLESMLRGSVPFMERYVPNMSLEMKTGEFFEEFAKSRIPEEAPPGALEQVVEGFIASVERQTRIELDPEARLVDSFDLLVNTKLKEFSIRNQTATFLTIALLVFFTLAGLGFLVKWVILTVAFLMFEVLYAFKFFHMEFESRDKEIIVV